jgi:chaperonin GroEL
MKISKDIKRDHEARASLLSGMEKVAESVATTLGPKGQNVAIANPSGTPSIIHDGVSVAKSINLEDPFEDMGAQLIKTAAQKTNDKAGDGTTTSSILALSIAKEGFSMVGSGTNPMFLKDQIDSALSDVLKELKKMSTPVGDGTEMVATISSASREIGEIVAKAINKVGKNGVVTVENGNGMETTVDYKQGMEIDRGFLSTQFITNEAKGSATVEDAYILITDKKINHNYELVPFLEKIMKETQSKNIVIFASEVLDEALGTLVVNKLRGALNCIAVQSPSYGVRRIDELWDIATVTGGTPILVDSGRPLETVEVSELGRAGKIISDREKTVILDGLGNPDSIKLRINNLEEQIQTAQTDFEKDIKKERLAKLSGGVAVINVGAPTEVALSDRKERVIDAVNATKAAIEEGIVAGGEITLLNLAYHDLFKGHNNPGGHILSESLKQPFKRLVENAGLDYADCWNRISNKKYPFGIDVADGKVKDLILSGIIDPVKVTRLALENAVSVATMAITTRVLIADHKEDKE